MGEGRRRNVFTLGVSVTMLPTRSCPFQFAVIGEVEIVSGTADDPLGDGGVAGVVGAADTGDPPDGGGGADGGGVPPGGGESPGGGFLSEPIRPKRAAARRILK